MIHRRAFLAGLSAAVTGARSAWAQATPIESFAQWMQASRREREDAVKACLERIRTLDPRFKRGSRWRHSRRWATARSRAFRSARRTSWKRAGSPRRTGSPIYKGRLGISDAAIVTSLRRRGAVLRRQDAHDRVRLPDAGSDAQPAQPRAHTWRQLQRFGCSRRGRHGAVRARHADARFDSQAGILLWRHRVQAELRPRPDRRRAAVREELGYRWLFHPHAGRHAGALGGDGPLVRLPAAVPVGAEVGSDVPLSVGLPNPMPEVDAEMATAVQNAIDKLRRAGIRTQSIDIADLLKTLDAATNDIAFYEGARFHEQRWKEHGARLLELADLVEKGLKMPAEQYERALQQIKEGQVRLGELYKTTPVILVPAATGAAPQGLGTLATHESMRRGRGSAHLPSRFLCRLPGCRSVCR